MVDEDLLLPHLLDGVVVVTLHRVVVLVRKVKILTSLLKNICAIIHLVDLDTQAAARSEVVRLGQVAEAVVLHGLQQQQQYERGDAMSTVLI